MEQLAAVNLISTQAAHHRRFGRCAALLCIVPALLFASAPALAFDESVNPSASTTTLTTLDVATSTVSVPYASKTIFDKTAPVSGVPTSPDRVKASPVSVAYSGASDAVSGLKSVSLWVRAGDTGTWGDTGQKVSTESGSFAFSGLSGDGVYYFALKAGDNAGNFSASPTGEGQCKTTFDATAPTITLVGESTVTVNVGDTYTDKGATAKDAVDGDITSKIAVVNPVNTSKEGTYKVAYNVNDTAGNAAQEVLRTVTVKAAATYAMAMSKSLTAKPGATVTCPVTLDNTKGVSAYGLKVAFDSTAMEVAGVTVGTAISSWGAPTVSIQTGSVALNGTGAVLGDGSGAIVNLQLKMKPTAKSGSTYALTFASASLNNGSLKLTTDNGAIKLLGGKYVWGDIDSSGTLTLTDATTILKHRTKLVDKTTLASKSAETDYLDVADVSGDDPVNVGTVDASLIKRMDTGLLTRFPVDMDGDGMGPEPEDATAGDADKSSGLDEYKDETTSRTVSVPGMMTLEPGAEIDVPISVSDASSVMGYYAELSYDSSVLSYVNTKKGTLTKEWTEPIVNPLEGQVLIACADTVPLSGSGSLAVVTFKVAGSITAGAKTNVYLAAAELNDNLIKSEMSSGTGEPSITALEPARGAESGGTLVRIKGTNLAAVDAVYFGEAPATWSRPEPTGNAVLAITPAGSSKVDVRVEGVTGSSTLAGAYTYFVPDAHLTVSPEEVAEAGGAVEVPVWLINLSDQATTVSFKLRFDPTVFTPQFGAEALATPGEAALALSKEVTAQYLKPGELEVRVAGGKNTAIQSGLLCTCHLKAIASLANTEGLIYISQTSAESKKAKTLSSTASIVPR